LLSDELKTALSIPPLAPPPWLINMQRFGPPPSYPSLRIPGLNAPIPEGAQWGYHPGGWGRPPIDEVNNISLMCRIESYALAHLFLKKSITDLFTETSLV
jgi:hypothetical protein